MAIADARAVIVAAGGTLACKPTTDPRMRECTGSMPNRNLAAPFRVLISSIYDSAAVIVLSGAPSEEGARAWIDALTAEFGTPNRERQPGGRGSWQWIRRSQMLRVILRGNRNTAETAITLTDGPLLDGLGGVQTRKPD